MNTYADNIEDNKTRAAAPAKQNNNGGGAFQFADNRPESISQRKLQAAMGNNPVAAQLRTYQDIANNSSAARTPKAVSNVAQRITIQELKDQSKPFIFKKNIKPYNDGEQFGHFFTIKLGIENPEELFWLEKTDKPYLETMRAGDWNNMYSLVPGSNVFEDFAGVIGEPGYHEITFVDPPSIKKTPNNHRVLEFYIHVIGNDRNDMITLTARQELGTDENGDIKISSFSFLEEKVYKSETSENEELSNPVWGDD